jgi:uncharacterized protein (DUF169 family)
MLASSLERFDRQLLELTNACPVAVTFTDSPPPGISRELNSQPSGCTFWKLAAEGKVFYTDASDHFGCAVGAYTHGAELPEAQTKELTGLVSTMMGLSYLKQEEVSRIPRRSTPLRCVLYAPLKASPTFPDVVLVRGNARQLMLLSEAARAANCLTDSSAMGRPACGMIPQSIASGQVLLSLGCIGNRVYTGLGDQEGYLAIPGEALEATCAQLPTIMKANDALEQFHRQRKIELSKTAA